MTGPVPPGPFQRRGGAAGDRPDPAALAAVARNWDRRAPGYHRYYQSYPELARDRWRDLFAAAIGELLNRSERPLRVLDVGSGTGFVATVLAELGHQVTAVDGSERMLEHAHAEASRRGVTVDWRLGDAHQPPGADFDLVTARYVLWTLPAPATAVTAWAGALRPGGAILIADGRWHGVRQLLATPRLIPGAVRDYLAMGRTLPHFAGVTAAQTSSLLRSAGFRHPRTFDQLLGAEVRPHGTDVFVLGAVAGH